MRRVVTGDRPTGRLHFGHYVGSLRSRVLFQHSDELTVIVADNHTYGTAFRRDQIEMIPNHIDHLLEVYFCVGLEPSKTRLYLQSRVPELATLYVLLGHLVTLDDLTASPSIRDMMKASGVELGQTPFALLGYPILQAADLLGCRAQLVPVGADGLAHVEITRRIATRFNDLYGGNLTIPDGRSEAPVAMLGLDGEAKMSKSRGNTIDLFDDEAAIRRKLESIESLEPQRRSAVLRNYSDLLATDPAEAAEFESLAGRNQTKALRERLAERIGAVTVGLIARRKDFPDVRRAWWTALSEGSGSVRTQARSVVEGVFRSMPVVTLRDSPDIPSK